MRPPRLKRKLDTDARAKAEIALLADLFALDSVKPAILKSDRPRLVYLPAPGVIARSLLYRSY